MFRGLRELRDLVVRGQRSRLTAVAASPAMSSHKAATPKPPAIDFLGVAWQQPADLALRHKRGAQGA